MRILSNIANTDIPDADYPKGRIRNRNLGGGIPGTPVIEEVYGDIIQFFQKLVDVAGITENDLPDNESNGHQLLEAFVDYIKDTDNIGYENVVTVGLGSDLTISSMGNNSAAVAINDTEVAFIDNGNDNLSTYRWDGNTFSLVGTPLAIGGTLTGCCICSFDEDKIALCHDVADTIQAYQWNGSTWSTLGSAFSVTFAPGKCCKVATNVIAVTDGSANTLSTYTFNGSTWSLTGNALSISGLSSSSICYLEDNAIAFAALTPQSLRRYTWDGSDWTLDGSALNHGESSGYFALIAHDPDHITFFTSGSTDHFRCYKWTGSAWEEHGIRGASTPGAGFPQQLTILPNNMIVHTDPFNELLKAKIRILAL